MKISHNIPHINTLYWESDCNKDKDKEQKAEKDRKIRDFGVKFFLEDLRARTQYTHVTLSEELSQHDASEDGDINMWFEKNKDGFLSAVLVGLKNTGHKKAFYMAHERFAAVLSMLTFVYSRPFRISKVVISDKKHKINYSTFNSCPKSEKLVLPAAALSKEVPFGSLLAIYREGMNSLDLAYRYISFFKIYEAWYKKDFAFELTDNVRGDQQRQDLFISSKLVSGLEPATCFKDFLNKTFNDKKIFKDLVHCRNMLAHYLLDRDKKIIEPHFISFDDVEGIEYIEAIGNLVERMATTILNTEFDLLAECDDRFKKLYEVYNCR